MPSFQSFSGRLAAVLLGVLVGCGFATDACGESPRFGFDVMAVLSKAGCNAGACHGNQNGKGGFKLSLRGQDPAADYETITHGQFARRIDRFDPDQSLILLKPTTQLAHEGGLRFPRDSAEYRILREWIAAGTPPDDASVWRVIKLNVEPAAAILTEPAHRQLLRVSADCANGSGAARTVDVTELAVYEPLGGPATVNAAGVVEMTDFGESTILVRFLDRQATVRLAHLPFRPEFEFSAPTPVNYIDDLNFAKLRALQMNPSPLSEDSEFVRRAYLDVIGLLPTAAEAQAFVADPGRNKRANLIDALLARPEFADFWALKWSDLLRIEERTLDEKGVQAFHEWIRASLADGKPLDQFVQEMLVARGSTYDNPPTNYWRAQRDPITRAETAAEVFLGVRLLCAKCHNHPFDRWSQADYYNWASFFTRLDYKVIENKRRDKNDSHEFDGEQLVQTVDHGEIENPHTGAAGVPAFLGAAAPLAKVPADRLTALAPWLTSKQNAFFARAQANRIWFHLLGRGIVEPIDDFRASNPPSNPELLDALARDFAAHGFDLRQLIRTIMLSRTYQLASTPNYSNRRDEANFSHALARRLTAEQLLDAVNQVLGTSSAFSGYPPGTRAEQIAGVKRARDKGPSLGDQFLKSFGRPPRLVSCECERTNVTTLSQAFQLLSGPLVNQQIQAADNRLGKWLAAERPLPEIIDELYWSALARPPSAAETAALVDHIAAAADRRAALEDAVWSILNAKEFLLQH
ncbi:MAG TPA: DUF1549 and DUF1553 domain-containing protein [Pirellulales bacterium]|jgi:hypothetical protein|nr:DUF1549 and DUF1553 domain-containing protein [Pirellulales bacterium]